MSDEDSDYLGDLLGYTLEKDNKDEVDKQE